MWRNIAFFMDFFFEASEFSSSSSFFRLWPKNTGRSAGQTCLVAVNMLKDATWMHHPWARDVSCHMELGVIRYERRERTVDLAFSVSGVFYGYRDIAEDGLLQECIIVRMICGPSVTWWGFTACQTGHYGSERLWFVYLWFVGHAHSILTTKLEVWQACSWTAEEEESWTSPFFQGTNPAVMLVCLSPSSFSELRTSLPPILPVNEIL